MIKSSVFYQWRKSHSLPALQPWKKCDLSNRHESLEQKQTARVGWTKEAQGCGTKNQEWSNIRAKGKTSLAFVHQIVKRQAGKNQKGSI